MRRFFKSAAFPILLVVILAFVASKVITSDSGPEPPSYNQLIDKQSGLIAEGRIEKVEINTKDNTLDVKRSNGESFSTGYPLDTEQSLITLLETERRRDQGERERRRRAALDRSPTSCPSSSSSPSGSS